MHHKKPFAYKYDIYRVMGVLLLSLSKELKKENLMKTERIDRKNVLLTAYRISYWYPIFFTMERMFYTEHSNSTT